MSVINCPNCGMEVPAGAAFCDNCGTPLAVVKSPAVAGGDYRCPRCGESVLPGEAFCGNCGAALPVAPVMTAAAAPESASSPPAQPAPPPPPAQVAAPPLSNNTCPNCGATVEPTDIFCDNCGQALSPGTGFPAEPQRPAAELSAASVAEGLIVEQEAPEPSSPAISPRLVVQSTGAKLNLVPGRSEYLIGREDPVSGSFPDIDLVPYGGEEGGVSRRHARIARHGMDFTIEDMNSVNYTFVNRQKLAPGVAQPLRDGDELRLGRVVLHFRLI